MTGFNPQVLWLGCCQLCLACALQSKGLLNGHPCHTCCHDDLTRALEVLGLWISNDTLEKNEGEWECTWLAFHRLSFQVLPQLLPLFCKGFLELSVKWDLMKTDCICCCQNVAILRGCARRKHLGQRLRAVLPVSEAAIRCPWRQYKKDYLQKSSNLWNRWCHGIVWC